MGKVLVNFPGFGICPKPPIIKHLIMQKEISGMKLVKNRFAKIIHPKVLLSA